MITMHGTVHIILLDEILQNIPEKIELLNRLIAADDEVIYAFILAKKNDKRKLSDLLDKRDALRRDELVKAILKSDKTYEEVLEFLETNTDEEDE